MMSPINSQQKSSFSETTNRNKILFVDDEKICHTLVQLIIQNFTEYEVLFAFTCEEAISLAHRYSDEIVLVLTDIMLPVFDGFSLYRHLRKEEAFASVPFVFQSGYTSQETEIASLGHKVSMIHKPYRQEDLLNAIKKALED